ncbi:hypothetical protein ASD81_00715 [Nocardioides sp. Root614]|nr:hypothetical protein ASD81_00715 [Nocardioides sp. Root614]KRA91259.1 hypothetical protein ASD84_00980 [Nocardioides sp. Root682]
MLSAREIVVEESNGIPIGYITRDSTNTLDATSALKSGAATAAGVALLGLKGVGGVAGGLALGGVASGLSGAVGRLARNGHLRYHLEVAGQRLATIRTPDPDDWGFVVEDPAGSKLASITKDWDGWTTAGLKPTTHYIVHLIQPLHEPLRSLVIAAALSIHTVEERT